MGKEKISSSHSRLFSPWQLSDKDNTKESSYLELFGQTNEFQDMMETVLTIERNQLEKIENDKEEDCVEDYSLMVRAQSLNIHSLSENTSFHLSEEDQAMSNLFISREQPPLLTLEQSVTEKGPPPLGDELCLSNPQVRHVYTRIGEYLSHYKAGRIPKAFEIIPSLNNWEHLLVLTNPKLWTPAATYEATKIFVTVIKPKQTKLFFQLVLLPNVRNNLKDKKTLDVPIYLALKKAIEESPCFFIKGFILPLCESNCTINEALVLATILKQNKMIVFQTSAALMKLSELKFSLPVGILVLVLLEKKQALPFRTVDALVARYFVSMAYHPHTLLPRIWFETLYLFVSSYGMDLIAPQKLKLLQLLGSIQPHELTSSIEKLLALRENELSSSEDSDMMSE